MSQWGEPKTFHSEHASITVVPHTDGPAFTNPMRAVVDELLVIDRQGDPRQWPDLEAKARREMVKRAI